MHEFLQEQKSNKSNRSRDAPDLIEGSGRRKCIECKTSLCCVLGSLFFIFHNQLPYSLVCLCITDIRETAFVYAITAAGVTHAVTQACSMGDLLQCGCEATRNRPPPKPLSSSSYGDGVKWEWGGCVDDVEFGYEKSKQFMDAKRRRGKSDIRALIDLHNNEAGRLVRDVYSGFCIAFACCAF